LFAKRLYGMAIAAEQQEIEFGRMRRQPLERGVAGLCIEQIDLLLADAVKAPLRLAALAMAMLDEAAAVAAFEQRIAVVDAHRPAAVAQQQRGQPASCQQQLPQRLCSIAYQAK